MRETDKNVTSEKGESPPLGIEKGLLEKVVLAVGSEAEQDFNTTWDLTGHWAYRRPGFLGPVVFVPVGLGGSFYLQCPGLPNWMELCGLRGLVPGCTVTRISRLGSPSFGVR